MKVQYSTKAISTGGRNGKVKVENSPLEFDMAPPAEMGGTKPGVNPEQLFAAGYAACFGGAVQHALRVKKLPVAAPTIELTVGLGKNEADENTLEVDIVAIFSGTDQATADAIVQEGHQICPYSRATRGNIKVTVSAKVE